MVQVLQSGNAELGQQMDINGTLVPMNRTPSVGMGIFGVVAVFP